MLAHSQNIIVIYNSISALSFAYIYIFKAIPYNIPLDFATVHSLMVDTNFIDSCQANLPVQYASNIKVLLQATLIEIARLKQASCLLHYADFLHSNKTVNTISYQIQNCFVLFSKL